METTQKIRYQSNWNQRLDFEAMGANYDDFIDQTMVNEAVTQHLKQTRNLSFEEAANESLKEQDLEITELDYKDINDCGEFEVVMRTFKIVG